MRILFLGIFLLSQSLFSQKPLTSDTANGYWSRLTQFIHRSIFVPERNRARYDSLEFVHGEQKFIRHRDKRIKSIHVLRADLMAEYDTNTNKTSDIGLAKFLNSLHFSTKEGVIKNNLLFKENDTVNPFSLADTERILRQLPYIADANIILLPREDEDFVDCIIVVQEKFAIGFSYNPLTPAKHKFNVYDRNLGGYGFGLSGTLYYYPTYQSSYDYEGQIYVDNLMGSFITSQLNYTRTQNENGFLLRFTRNFLTPKFKYAGGFTIAQVSEFDTQIKLRTYDLQDLWIGRSFLIDPLTNRKNIIAAVRIGQIKYRYRPPVSSESNQIFHDYQLLLASLTYRKIDYLQTNMVLSFGSTEDIPAGYMFKVTGGIKNEEYHSKFYFGTTAGFAGYIQNIGYFGLRTELGTYHNNNKLVQTVWRNTLNYLTELYSFHEYFLRSILYATYTTTDQRLHYDNLYLDSYLRDFSNRLLPGKQRLSLTVEPVLFTPLHFLGFKVALFSFSDLGFITENKFLFSPKNKFGSIGIGLRILNESLVFNRLEIRFSFVSAPTNYSPGWYFHYSGNDPQYYRSVQLTRPEFITYE